MIYSYVTKFLVSEGWEPPHFPLITRQWLNVRIPGTWIDRGEPVSWRPTSPDLSVVAFLLWGHLKSAAYANRLRAVETLKEGIQDGCEKENQDGYTACSRWKC
jgi:hypothetical protein